MLYVIEGTTGNIYVGNFTEVPVEDNEENPQNFFFLIRVYIIRI